MILMSAFTDSDLEPEFAAMGADVCLDKMAHHDVIREAVETALALWPARVTPDGMIHRIV